MLDLADSLRDEVAGHAALLRGYLQMGTVGSGTNTLLPQVLAEFCRQHPGVDIYVREGGALDIATAVRAGDLEIGLVINEAGKQFLEGLDVQKLLSSRLVVCVDSLHAIRQRASVTLDELSGERLILFRTGYLMHEVVAELIQRREIRAVFQTDNTESAKRMVAAGVGVMLFPEFSILDDTYRQLGKVAYVPLSGRLPTIELCVIRRRDRTLSPAAEIVWGMLITEAEKGISRRAGSATIG
jgi:DNA-binding transcriptional LysR family regulator